MLIKDLTKVKDEEITLQDVKRAEEIIARANRLLGRETKCNHYHYNYEWWRPVTPFLAVNKNPLYENICLTGSGATSLKAADTTLSMKSSIVDAANYSVNKS